MRILTKDEIDEDLCFPIIVRHVWYEEEETGLLGLFATVFGSKVESVIDGDVIAVYTVEYKNEYYYKFVSTTRPQIGPLYVPFEIQNSRHACFGNELRDMHAFKHTFVLKFDQIFHQNNGNVEEEFIVLAPKDVLDTTGTPGVN